MCFPDSIARSKLLRISVLALIVLLAACQRSDKATGGFRSAAVDRGDIRVVIAATGNLRAVSTVDVGAQISGQVVRVLADFNQRVSAGEVIAEIDPANFEARLAQARADLLASEASRSAARANDEEARVTLKNAEKSAERARQVRDKGLISQADLDAAMLAADQARARLKSSAAAIAVAEAAVTQRAAAVSNAELDLGHTRIRAPVDGIVLSRTVQPGQTVAASFQTPVLFQIAEDLSEMQLDLAIDEADVGQVDAGQAVSFTVDAFPNRRFQGLVKQVRMAATNTANVISYPVIVSVDNPDQRLFPGMTANAEIEVGARPAVLRLPNAALRFTPPGMSAESTGQRERGQRGPGGGGAELADKLKLNPEQRAVFDAAMQRMREAAQAQAAAQQAGGGMRGGGGDNFRAQMQQRFAKVINELKPLLDDEQKRLLEAELAQRSERRRAVVWVMEGKQPRMVPVSVGLSDGEHTELVDGPLAEGALVLTGSAPAAP